MQQHKENIIFDRKNELYQLKKRISYLEQELNGMGLRNFDFTNEELKKMKLGETGRLNNGN